MMLPYGPRKALLKKRSLVRDASSSDNKQMEEHPYERHVSFEVQVLTADTANTENQQLPAITWRKWVLLFEPAHTAFTPACTEGTRGSEEK